MAVIILVIAISAIKYRADEVNYLNADATWHTLLTIEAYNETPISEHLFLPIVSLGEDSDKYIPWGATVPDNKGNYYYTSFSPAGYFAPWFFIKVFHLDVTEKSLYIFNVVLLSISAVIWMLFIQQIYEGEKYRYWLSVLAAVLYILTPEVLHGMGIVYWSQSLMQVTLIAQIIAFYNKRKSGSMKATICFYLLALANPYIEWTGYIANVGFAFAVLILGYKGNWKKAFGKACILGGITIASFVLFSCHYLLRIDSAIFFETLKNRFMARNVMTAVELTSVFGSYFKSFLYLWVLLLILIVWNIVIKKNIEFKHRMLMLVLIFPILENVIMKEHALSYSYDRMKVGFIMSFVLCDLAFQILEYYKESKKIIIVLTLLVMCFGGLNLKSYMGNSAYTWNTNYRGENNKIAEYVNTVYSDSVLGVENAGIRGYMNLLFGRGIYEYISADRLKEIAAERGKQYAVILNIENYESWQVYDLAGATIYDITTGEVRNIQVDDGNINDALANTYGSIQGYCLSSMTDENWTNGYSNTSYTLLFEYDSNLLEELLLGTNIKCEDEIFVIKNIDYDDLWIRVLVDRDAAVCMYPNNIQIE